MVPDCAPGARGAALLLALAAALAAVGGGCVARQIPEGQCVFSEDCRSPLVCVSNFCRQQCRSDRDCTNSGLCRATGQAGLSVCYAPGETFLCRTNAECPPPLICTREGRCGSECVSDYDCQVRNPRARCVAAPAGADGGAADAGVDGSVAVRTCTIPVDTSPCPGGATRCNGACVDTRTDLNNCGGCGAACAPAHATGVCTGGGCDITACDPGYGNCDGNTANGCETATSADPAHCGSCATACSLPNATAGCAAGRCTVASCSAGFGDCDAMAANGCETNTQANAAHCGSCRTMCMAPTPLCSNGMCAASCAAGLTQCGSNCVVTATDPANCGACGTVCPAPPNATATCAAGRCGFACAGGFADCDGVAANGCEANLNSDVAHCGACATPCAPAHAAAACTSGMCVISSCNAGYANCDGMVANGCETSVTSNNANCGACGVACAAGATCAGGACTCPAGQTVCSNGTALACTNLLSDVANCGACGNACPTVTNGMATCTAGMCGITCAAGYMLIGGACVVPPGCGDGTCVAPENPCTCPGDCNPAVCGALGTTCCSGGDAGSSFCTAGGAFCDPMTCTCYGVTMDGGTTDAGTDSGTSFDASFDAGTDSGGGTTSGDCAMSGDGLLSPCLM